jgi:hypothetical protein
LPNGGLCEKLRRTARPKGVGRNNALEKLIEGGNSDDLTNYGR